MLAFLAAVVPILGSLYAGASFLIERGRLRRELEIRDRVQRLAWAREPAAEARAQMRNRLEPGVWHSPVDEISNLERRLLAANGLERGPSAFQADVMLAMSGTPASRAEGHRQWVLLLSAAVGVVLLAIDAM